MEGGQLLDDSAPRPVLTTMRRAIAALLLFLVLPLEGRASAALGPSHDVGAWNSTLNTWGNNVAPRITAVAGSRSIVALRFDRGVTHIELLSRLGAPIATLRSFGSVNVGIVFDGERYRLFWSLASIPGNLRMAFITENGEVTEEAAPVLQRCDPAGAWWTGTRTIVACADFTRRTWLITLDEANRAATTIALGERARNIDVVEGATHLLVVYKEDSSGCRLGVCTSIDLSHLMLVDKSGASVAARVDLGRTLGFVQRLSPGAAATGDHFLVFAESLVDDNVVLAALQVRADGTTVRFDPNVASPPDAAFLWSTAPLFGRQKWLLLARHTFRGDVSADLELATLDDEGRVASTQPLPERTSTGAESQPRLVATSTGPVVMLFIRDGRLLTRPLLNLRARALRR